MGTRSITTVLDEDGNKIIEMYKQYDGYPSGLGIKLQDFISSGKIANGISCFTAQLIKHFKEGAGGIYLHTPTTNTKDKKEYYELYGAEYYYEIDSNLNIRCWDTCTGKEEILDDRD